MYMRSLKKPIPHCARKKFEKFPVWNNICFPPADRNITQLHFWRDARWYALCVQNAYGFTELAVNIEGETPSNDAKRP